MAISQGGRGWTGRVFMQGNTGRSTAGTKRREYNPQNFVRLNSRRLAAAETGSWRDVGALEDRLKCHGLQWRSFPKTPVLR